MGKIYQSSNHRQLFGNAKKASYQDVYPPIFYCETCANRCEDYCMLFKRHVLSDFNRCFFHTNYTPVSACFCKSQSERQAKSA